MHASANAAIPTIAFRASLLAIPPIPTPGPCVLCSSFFLLFQARKPDDFPSHHTAIYASGEVCETLSGNPLGKPARIFGIWDIAATVVEGNAKPMTAAG